MIKSVRKLTEFIKANNTALYARLSGLMMHDGLCEICKTYDLRQPMMNEVPSDTAKQVRREIKSL